MFYPFYNYEDEAKTCNIGELFKYCKDNDVAMFPTSASLTFWIPYSQASAHFDRYFYQKFKAFKLVETYSQGATMSDMHDDFKDLVSAFFTLNDKRYSELFRVQVLSPEAYDIVNNYDLTEEIERNNTGTQRQNYGARSDSETKSAVTTTFHGGSMVERHQKGATEERTLYAEHTDTNGTTLGAQTSTSTGKKSAFNSSSLVDVTGGSISNGARTDSGSVTYGGHTDKVNRDGVTDTDSRDAITNSEHTGAHSDSFTKGAQEDTRTDNLKEVTQLHRYGNIGVQTAAQVIGGHIDLWKAFRFYQLIFDEFADEYLRIDDMYGYYGNNSSSGGGGSTEELMEAIQQLQQQVSDLSTQQTTSTRNIRADISDLSDKETTDTTNVRGDISTLSGKVTTEADRTIATVSFQGGAQADRVIAAVTLQGASLHGDIVEVTTNGY